MSGLINADFNQTGNSVFENVYVYGDFQYEFDRLNTQYIHVDKSSIFVGIATFKDDVTIDGRLNINYLTVNKEFEVGVGGTIFTAKDTNNRVGVHTVTPIESFQVGIGGSDSMVVTGLGTVGIGTTNPYGNWTDGNALFSDAAQGPLKLDIEGSAHISRNLYDRVGSPGLNNYWLKRDEFGIRWQPTPPSEDTEGIKIQNEGQYIPIVGVAQTFDTINFVQFNSLGVGTDTLNATTNLPIWNRVINDRSGTIGAGSNVVSISTATVEVGWVFRPDIGTPTDLLADGEAAVNEIGVGNVTLNKNSLLGVSQTVNWDIGPYEHSGIATVTTFDLWGYDFDVASGGTNSGIYRMTPVGFGNATPASHVRADIVPTGVGTGAFIHGTTSGNMLDIRQTGTGNAVYVEDSANPDTTPFVITNEGNVGIATTRADDLYGLDSYKKVRLRDQFIVDGKAFFNNEIDVDLHAEFNATLNVDGEATFQDNVIINADSKVFDIQNDGSESKFTVNTSDGNTVGRGTLEIDGAVNFNLQTDASSKNSGGSLTVDGGTAIQKRLYVGGVTYLESTTQSTTKDTGALVITDGGAGIEGNVNVGSALSVTGISTFVGFSTFKDEVGIGSTLTLKSHIADKNNDIGFSDEVGVCKTDYRLASTGVGVSWRPSGVETKNTIWVSINGCDNNTGLLEGDAKRTIGAAAAIALTGDTIKVRSGVYYENNPVGLRTEVTVTGEDLRLVTIVPNNTNKDVFHVRAGCLIQNMNFAGQASSTNHPNCGAVAFPPTQVAIDAGIDYQAVTGYTIPGPANQGPSRTNPSEGGRYRSPYVRNCTNFMTGSIGMKIDGDYVNAAFEGTNDLGQDLKSMVCDSFTQYNENGIGVSITNNAYAQLVSIFTIGCDIAIFCGSGGQCDLTNSNSSFGNVGLKADGVGDIEFFGFTDVNSIAGQDAIVLDNVRDIQQNFRKPFDGQGAYFHINMDDYADSPANGMITKPLQLIRSLDIVNGGSGYNQGAPPNVIVQAPQGPEAILPEFSANVSAAGSITSIDVIASGRNFLPDQELTVTFSSGNASATVNTDPILYTVDSATEPTNSGMSTVTFNEFIPYNIGVGVSCEFVRLSRIITSSHSFEYVGAGTDLNRANPFQGGEPIPENEIISINGGQVPFTSTDQKGNFRIGDGLTIDQTTSTIRGRDFNRAIQAQLTPLILALR